MPKLPQLTGRDVVKVLQLFGWVILSCQIILTLVIPAGKRVSSAMDGKLKSFHGAWIPAIHAGMTNLENGDHVI